MKGESRAGFSLPELLIVITIFSGFLLIVHYLLSSGFGAWRRTASSQDSGLQLAKAQKALRNDLQASGVTVATIASSPHFLPASSGDALWMLSAVEPEQGEILRKDDGTPLWRRNILYYLAVPTEHARIFGQSCLNKPYHCPHKLLIRRVFDGANEPTPDDDIEAMMTEVEIRQRAIAPAVISPDISGPAAERTDIVATGMVSFEVRRGSGDWSGEIEYRLRAFNGEGVGKVSALGREDLRNSPFTHEILGSVFPGN